MCKHSQSRGVNLTPPAREVAEWEKTRWGSLYQSILVAVMSYMGELIKVLWFGAEVTANPMMPDLSSVISKS